MTIFALFARFFVRFSSFFCTFVVQMCDYTLNIKGKLFSLARPRVMAIINATTDSFAFSCKNISEAEILSLATKALSDGADILDVGGCSTKPGSTPVDEAEEWRRVAIALKSIRSTYPEAIVSVDTFRASVAREAVQTYRADMINDISGGIGEMYTTIAELAVPYILTHNAPLNNQLPVSVQVIDNLIGKVDELHKLGVKDVIIDPGFGFNKTLDQNYELLKHLKDLEIIGLPILAGLSRKSMLYKQLDVTPTSEDALTATIATNMMALHNGASILRVHDVKEAVQTVAIYNKIR